MYSTNGWGRSDMDNGDLLFIGMEETGFACLERLLELGAPIRYAYTLDESRKESVIAFKSFDSLKERFAIEIRKVTDINEPPVIAAIQEMRPDLILVVSWSQLVHANILRVPRLGSVGFHASLLPKHRGRAPVPWAIIFGLKRSGLTMFYLTPNADDGDIIGQEQFDITIEDDAYSVYKKVETGALRLLETHWQALLRGTGPRIRQVTRETDYWPKRVPSDGYIDWNRSARHLYDWVRALTYPFPGAFTYLGPRKLFIWKARLFSEEPRFESGRIYRGLSSDGVLVGTGQGALLIEEAQLSGEQKKDGRAFMEEVADGMHFE
jgi:methionyl-tRNA formyltransferase